MSNGTDSTYPAGTFGPDGSVIKSPWYEYLVNRGVAYTFVILFGGSTGLHFIQALWYRMWWLLPTVILGGLGECAAWGSRLWSSFRPLNQTPYTIQVVAAILAPTPFLGSIFMIFRRITQLLGTQYSRLSPRWYSRIFITADVVALFVQAAGGSIADSNGSLGANIMLGGIIFQLVCLIIFISVATEYYVRYTYDRPLSSKLEGLEAIRGPWGRNMKILRNALVVIIIFLVIRSIYRICELADGFNGTIINTEWYFDVFDGAMVTGAMWTMNFFHPGRYLKLDADNDDATIGETMLLQRLGSAPYTPDPEASGAAGKDMISSSTPASYAYAGYPADKRPNPSSSSYA